MPETFPKLSMEPNKLLDSVPSESESLLDLVKVVPV